jgi:hypothetical protein
VTDAVAGDEGIDDGFAGKPFKPGKPETYVKDPKIKHDIGPENMGEEEGATQADVPVPPPAEPQPKDQPRGE